MNLLQLVLVGLVRLYQLVFSPLLHMLGGPGSGCRFQPTCSVYAIEAIEVHGARRGFWLAVKRFSRCHPWGGHGYDPVPPPEAFCDASK